ncbi:hypothetical protein ECZU20_00040 [Escherichia coli]|nr:hypothetical protein ECZU20_00040 [Escherichia coli]
MGMMVAHTGYRMIYLLGALLVVVAGGVYALQMKGKSGVALVVAKRNSLIRHVSLRFFAGNHL